MNKIIILLMSAAFPLLAYETTDEMLRFCLISFIVCTVLLISYITNLMTPPNGHVSCKSPLRSPYDMSTLDDCLYAIVMGEPGSGKTSTMKSLVQNEIHQYDADVKYCRNSDAFGRNVEVVHCKSSSPTNVCQIEENLRYVFKYQEETHVIILCIPFQYDKKDDDVSYLDALKSVYGDDIIKNNVIVAITFGERFEKTRKAKGYKNFEHWKTMLKSSHLKELIKECNNRCILFQNAETKIEIMQKQAYDFHAMADQIKHENSKRINANYTTRRGVLSSSETVEPYPTATPGSATQTKPPTTPQDSKDDIAPIDSRYFEGGDPVKSDDFVNLKIKKEPINHT